MQTCMLNNRKLQESSIYLCYFPHLQSHLLIVPTPAPVFVLRYLYLSRYLYYSTSTRLAEKNIKQEIVNLLANQSTSSKIPTEMAARQNNYFFRFTSPHFPELCQHYEQIKQYFNSFEVCDKLYMCSHRYFGKVYYKSPEIVAAVQALIRRDNIHEFEMGRLNDDEYPVYNGGQTSNDISTEITNVFFDANGTCIGLLEDFETKNQYINIKDAQKAGFQTFPTIEEAQKHVINELNGFLTSQAKMYLKLKGFDYEVPNDIEINIKFRNNVKESEKIAPKIEPKFGAIAKPKFEQTVNAFSKMASFKSVENVNVNKEHRGLNNVSPSSQKENKYTSPAREMRKAPFTQRPLTEKPIQIKENNAGDNGFPNLGFKVESQTSLNSDLGSVHSFKSVPQKSVQARLTSPAPPKMTPMQRLHAMNRPTTSAASNGVQKIPTKCNKIQKYPEGSVFVDKMAGLTEATIQFVKPLTSTTFIAFIITDESEQLDELTIEHELLTPSAGELVVVQDEDERIGRAFILEIKNDKYKVASIDFAVVMEVDKIFELNTMWKGFDEFVCICEASADYVKAIQKKEVISVTSKQNNVLIDLQTKVEIACYRWIPEEFQLSKNKETITNIAPVIKPKPPQKIFTSLPTAEMPVKIYDLVGFVKFAGGILYLRSKEMFELAQNMNKKLENQQLESLEKPPSVGQYVLFNKQKHWVRCLVQKIDGSQVQVEYIDLCDVDSVPIKDLFNLNEHAVFGPTLIKKRLRNFEDKEYSENATAALLELIRKKFIVSFIQDDIIDLKADANDEKQLSDLLLDLDAPQILTLSDLPASNLAMNEEMKILVTHVEDEDIYFWQSSNEQVLDEVTAGLANMDDVDDLESIAVGQLCVAPYEGECYRAEVKQIKGSRVTVYFFDFGNTAVVDDTVIKTFPEDLLAFAPCAVSGYLTEDSIERGEATYGNAYMAEIKRKVGNKHYVKLIATNS